jgi:NAD(P)-dependent dehydrogenase (short-subunit alcohol dehydrogenase family)
MIMAGLMDGRVAVLTGGGGGIAGAIARRFASEGAAVLVTDLRLDAAEKVAADIKAKGGRAVAFKANVANAEEAKAAVAEAVSHFGKVTTLVNAVAAVTPDAKVEDLPLEDWNNTLAVNLTSYFLMCKYAVPEMRKAGGGTIVNIASSHGHFALHGRMGYCTTKAAIHHMTRVMALDYGPENIRFNTISPGPIETERSLRRYGTHEKSNEIRGVHQAMKRTGTVEEIAEGALYLASDMSSFVTGADIRIDGGQTIFKGEAY